MTPAEIAAEHPGKVAYVMAASGETVTYAELEAAANRGAHLFRKLGLKRGDHIAILLENHPRFLGSTSSTAWTMTKRSIAFCVASGVSNQLGSRPLASEMPSVRGKAGLTRWV